jgi:hypothetical protein
MFSGNVLAGYVVAHDENHNTRRLYFDSSVLHSILIDTTLSMRDARAIVTAT